MLTSTTSTSCAFSVSDTGSVQKGPLVTVYSSGLVFSSEPTPVVSVWGSSLSTHKVVTSHFPPWPLMVNYTWLTEGTLIDLHSELYLNTCCVIINYSFVVYIVKSIRLETFSSDEVLGKISEVGMVTKGEWEHDSLETINYTSAVHINKSKFLYTLRKSFQWSFSNRFPTSLCV